MSELTSDEILSALSLADELLGSGHSLEQVCRALGVTPETYHIWRQAHSRTFLATSRQVEALREVISRLAEVLVEQQSMIRHLESCLRSAETDHSTA